MSQWGSGELKRSGDLLGWIFFLLGLTGLFFAVFEYSIYSRNKDVLEWNQAFGADTPEEHKLVKTQLAATIVASILGTALAIAGVDLVLSAYFYNRELDRIELLEAVKGQPKPIIFTSIPGARSFCDNCGNPLEPRSRFCPSCGKVIQHDGRA